MENNRIRHHISRQFNEELEDVRNKVLAMGGLVEEQINHAITALANNDVELAESVITHDYQVNALEVAIDEECTQILARRQPTAFDLRLVIAVIKTITDLERIGDQAERVARMAIHLSEMERPKNQYSELQHLGDQVRNILHAALDAFARMDAEDAVNVAKEDLKVDREYDGIMRQMITHMMEDPRNVKRTLDVMWSARALERIGDHARNICEYIIYLVKGKDVRHTSFEKMEEEAKGD
ncbi:MAG: phosphate signaling complex protein PhoU [Gammaproteobacteria bacterium]|nr:phosphate signaling complex protein PhoU [Gammaproteobacteria bacterium]MDH5800875.1 phosphate signaling complex protein PhoU [Gammaproteobacteria bacterium]